MSEELACRSVIDSLHNLRRRLTRVGTTPAGRGTSQTTCDLASLTLGAFSLSRAGTSHLHKLEQDALSTERRRLAALGVDERDQVPRGALSGAAGLSGSGGRACVESWRAPYGCRQVQSGPLEP